MKSSAWSFISSPLSSHQSNLLPSSHICHERRKAIVSDPELSITLIFQFSHSIKEAIICPVLMTKSWFMHSAENFVGFDYPSAYGSSSLLCFEKHRGFHFHPQWNSSLWNPWFSFYPRHVQSFELCLIIKYRIRFLPYSCRLLCVMSV